MGNIQSIKVGTPVIARRWAAAVIAAGGGFQPNSMQIASNFAKALQSKSYYPKIKYLMPFLGVGVAAAITPLIDVSGAGRPTNTGFVDADFTQSTGLQGNGSSKRLAMPFNGSILGTSDNGGIGFWALNVSVAAGTQYGLGYSTSGGSILGLRFGNGAGDINCQFYWGAGGGLEASLSELRSNSHYYGNRSSATSRILYKNGVSAATNTTSSSVSSINSNAFGSYVTGTSSPAGYWGGSKGVEYYTDGTMTADEVADFHSLLTTCLMIPTGRI